MRITLLLLLANQSLVTLDYPPGRLDGHRGAAQSTALHVESKDTSDILWYTHVHGALILTYEPHLSKIHPNHIASQRILFIGFNISIFYKQ